MSSEEIGKGTLWRNALDVALSNSRAAIACLTPDNTRSPWLHFEAGALFAHVPKYPVYTYLWRLSAADIGDPFSQYQHTIAEQVDTRRLISSMNQLLGQEQHPKDRLDKMFAKWWPELEEKLALSATMSANASAHPRPDRQLLEEALLLLRQLSSQSEALLRERRADVLAPSLKTDQRGELRVTEIEAVNGTRAWLVQGPGWARPFTNYEDAMATAVVAARKQGQIVIAPPPPRNTEGEDLPIAVQLTPEPPPPPHAPLDLMEDGEQTKRFQPTAGAAPPPDLEFMISEDFEPLMPPEPPRDKSKP